MSAILSAGLAVLVLGLLLKLARHGRREAHLPPGPPTVPLFGNLLILPRTHIHLVFTEWSRRWGSIFSLKVGSSNMIVLSSAAAVRDVIDKTGWKGSSRPGNFYADLVCGKDMHIVFLPDGPSFRAQKKVMNTLLSPVAIQQYAHLQDAESSQLLYDLLKKPKDFYYALRRLPHSIAKSAIYGTRVPHFDSPDATIFYDAIHSLEHAASPGTHPPMEIFPFLKYLPDRWAPWIEECRETKAKRDGFHLPLFRQCEARVERKLDCRSLMEEVLRRKDEFEIDRETIAYLGIVLLDSGSDTTAALLQSLVLFLVAFPDVRHRAQQEIDAVVGEARLPIPEDFAKLPYVAALIKEVIRIRPVLPLTIPHYTSDDIQYNGFLIPKDSILMVNLWAIFHDPDVFENPEEFDPERFMRSEHGTKPGVDDYGHRDTLLFGSGRRICPGMHLAQETMELATMRLLWAFDLEPEIDPQTESPMEMDLNDYTNFFTLNPRPFKCRISARSAHHAQIIESAFSDAAETFRLYEDKDDPDAVGKT